MDKLDIVKEEVEKIYTSKNPEADPWIYWGYPNHVLIVAKDAKELAKQHGANVEFVVAGALLHDIADAVMRRNKPNHEEESLKIASDILKKAEFSDEEIRTITEDIIIPHSCHDIMPEIIEAKIVSTADSMAHLGTDFYIFIGWFPDKYLEGYDAYKDWAREKIERDYHKKIFFDDVREKLKFRYEALKSLFA
ncbi:MAG: HD domain-containing protein [Parcubacteria group bacterium]